MIDEFDEKYKIISDEKTFTYATVFAPNDDAMLSRSEIGRYKRASFGMWSSSAIQSQLLCSGRLL